jgi:HPt (histidine-containing phosphotransfer) domain-containing protein
MNSVERFRFNRALDHEYLDQIYHGDLHYAIEIFDTFLHYSLEEFQALPQALQQGDLTALHNSAHKLKTAFSMVGLTGLASTLNRLEKATLELADPSLAGELLQTALQEMNDYLPLIKHELGRMKTLAE